jgi:uncharacterized SAM-binding protein YcdF (DUF218 family)
MGLIAVAVVAHPVWLPRLGFLLVNAEPPQKADRIVVLAGDRRGNRVLKGAELVRQGYAPKAALSSPVDLYGVGEGELAMRFAGKHGYPQDMFEPIPTPSNSSAEEAVRVLAEARRRGWKKLLVVTSDYHTRRARRIYEGLSGDIEVHVTAAPDTHFQAASWWKHREGRKVWLLEFTKLVTSLAGM